MDQVEEKKRTNLKIRAASFRSRELVEMGGKEHRRGGEGPDRPDRVHLPRP